jgi:signal transduction histidine kinase
MQEDGKGILWFATGSEIGTLEKGTFRVYLSDTTPYREIESFIVQHDSLIWIAKRTGLFLFHVKSGRIEEIKGLTGSYVRTLKLDDDGTLWVGTYGQGFYRYKNQHLVKFPADKNGYLLIAHCFMEDKNGFFWIPTNRGLFQIKKSDLNGYADGKAKAVYYQYYDKSNGFATNEFNGGCNPCGIRISDRSFVLPSLNGLVKFDPESIHPLLPSSPIFIDKISADSISYLPFRSFTLNPKFHQLVFEVSSVYYGNANNNNIEYYIRGFGDKWYPLNEDGKITITSLPHGDYELQLRKLAGFGRDNYVYKNISFAVAPEFFETTWFRLLVLLILIMLIWYGFRIRYNILKKQKLDLEKQVAERTAALQQSVQKLQQSENALYSTIQQKEKITSILIHDLKSPLRFLTLVSDHIHSQIDNGNKDELKKLTHDIKQSSRRISMFTDEFLSWLLAAKEDFTSAHEIVKLKTLADETKDFFEEIIAASQNILEVNIPDDLTVIGDERLLRVIVRNLIDNANKHTRRGRIQLEGLHVNNQVEIKVKDNGNGMSAEQLKSFSDLDGNTLGFSLNVANQLGSRIIRNFIHKLGGTLTAESEVGKGTTITLIFKKSEK